MDAKALDVFRVSFLNAVYKLIALYFVKKGFQFMTMSLRFPLFNGLMLSVLLPMACSKVPSVRPVAPSQAFQELDPEANAKILVLKPDAHLRAEARRLGLRVVGETVVEISGSVSNLKKLSTTDQNLQAIVDQPIEVTRSEESSSPSDLTMDHQTMYLAKKEFGLLDWLKSRPQSDGRGVVVGVMDDGIAPDLSGLRETSTGERKLIALGKNKSALDTTAVPYTREAFTDPFYSEVPTPAGAVMYAGAIHEKTAFNTLKYLDLNRNGSQDTISFAVVVAGGATRVCVDANLNHKVDGSECFGTFAATGEYGYWDSSKIRAAWAEFDLQTLSLSMSAGEYADTSGDVDFDSHGEGVATVMAGHQVAGRAGPAFDGLAPGAKIVSYDLSEPSTDGVGSLYTAGTFLRGYEWLGQQGAEVINTSYSFFFYSAETQAFFNKAVAALIEKYHFVMSFSAGNNGPGLGSFNRGLMYPESALVAGAFVSKELDEYVHGVTGLPEEGRVVFYSSRGPAPDGGRSPTVISPLASLTHSTVGQGYQAFNGTSSASPALAGFAAVLVSAIKQEGLAVDPLAVTHAIRASATRLPEVAFIDQGFGLPEISKALALYKEITGNQRFVYVSTKAQSGSGIFMRASELRGDVEIPVELTGKVSPIQDLSTIDRLLIPTTLEANVAWLNHPSRGWVSVGKSTAYISFKRDDVLSALSRSGAGELTGEVVVKNTATSEVLAVIPVTIVDDRDLPGARAIAVTLGAEEGKRFHVGIDPSTIGLEVSIDQVNPDGVIAIMGYDANGVRGARMAMRSGRKLMIPTPTKGWNQISFMRWGGTSLNATAHVTIRPIQLSLVSKVASAEDSKITVRNSGTETNGNLAVFPARSSFYSAIKIGRLDEVQSWEIPLPTVGTLWSTANIRSNGNVSYVSSHCAQWLQAKDGSIVGAIPSDGTAFDITEDHLKAASSLQLRCSAFEAGAKPTGSTQVEWNVDVKFFAKREDNKPWSKLATILPVRWPAGLATIDSPVAVGSGVELFYRAGVDGGDLYLGAMLPATP